ncbi:unnamed protein product, partial [Polarella glacialis]
MMYATYRRCFLDSRLLWQTNKLLTFVLAIYVLYSAIVSKDHLLQEELSKDEVLFARLEEIPGQPAQCSALNATGLCIEWSWLEAVEGSSERLFLATYVQETLYQGGPQLQPLTGAGSSDRLADDSKITS